MSSLADAAKAFQAELLHVIDSKSAGTEGGTFTSGDWRTRTLNTVSTNEISGASLSSNQITLPAGTFFIIASAPGHQVNRHQARLRNTTDGTTTLAGTTEYAGVDAATAGGMSRSFIVGRFTIAAQKVFEIQHQSSVTKSGDGFGNAADHGETELYSWALIWKVA